LSKISERLNKLGQSERSGFGFGSRTEKNRIPVILLGVNIAGPCDAKGVDADLFILAAGSKGAAQKSAVKDADIWGVSVSGGSDKEIDAAVKSGADFVVAEGESAPGAALRDDDTGKGFIVPADISDDRVKAIEAGPFDFLILDGTNISLPLSVGSVLDIVGQLAKYSRHIFLRMSQTPDQANLELLRDIGISALIYDAGKIPNKNLKSLQGLIEKLETKKQKSASDAMLPRSGESARDADNDDHHDHDDDDDDEDEDWD
jgi:hypothetical protein